MSEEQENSVPKRSQRAKAQPVQAQPEIIIAPDEQQKRVSKDDLSKILESEFAAALTKVYVNSLDREVAFREVKVVEQKALTRTMAANENRKDIAYDAQCALINELCLDSDFDVYKVSEFDRLKLMMAIYQANMFQNEIKFTCEECGAENRYRIDFDRMIGRLDEFDLDPKKFSYGNRSFDFEFTVAYPTVRRVSSFYASFCAKHKGKSRQQVRADDGMANMEYVNLFIRAIRMTNKATGATRDIDLTGYGISDAEEILSKFPQDVLYTDKGVVTFVVEEFIKPLNDSFDKHKCFKCGHEHEKGDIDNPESFF